MKAAVDTWHDLRLAARRARRARGFSVVVVSMLALGSAAAMAMFSIFRAVVLQPLPFGDPGTLVAIGAANLARGVSQGNASMGDFVDWRRQARSFEGIAASSYTGLVLIGAGEPEEIPAAAVSWNLLRVLRVRPLLGRGFLPQEETPGWDQVVLLSHRLWHDRFAADPRILGHRINLSGAPYEVIGVMPPDFKYPDRGIEIWSPMALDPGHLVRQRRGMRVIARLRRGVGIRQAEQEIDAVASRLAREHPDTNAGWGAALLPLEIRMSRDSRPALEVLLGATSLMLLAAYANVGTLLRARAAAREREVVVQAALGAGALRLLRQALLEGLLFSLAGCMSGAALAGEVVRLVARSTPVEIPRLEEAEVGGPALVAALLLALPAGVLLGVVSAPGLGPVRRSRRAQRPRPPAPSGGAVSMLVALQAGLAVVLLTGTGLLGRTLLSLARVELGFEPHNLLVCNISLPLTRYAESHRQRAFWQQLRQGLLRLPGALSVAHTTALPLNPFGLRQDLPLILDGVGGPGARAERVAGIRVVSAHYFATLGIALRAGRDLSQLDGADSPPVAVVNQRLARLAWPGETPLGKHVELDFIGRRRYEVVGLVADVRQHALDREPDPEIYLSAEQHPSFFASFV